MPRQTDHDLSPRRLSRIEHRTTPQKTARNSITNTPYRQPDHTAKTNGTFSGFIEWRRLRPGKEREIPNDERPFSLHSLSKVECPLWESVGCSVLSQSRANHAHSPRALHCWQITKAEGSFNVRDFLSLPKPRSKPGDQSRERCCVLQRCDLVDNSAWWNCERFLWGGIRCSIRDNLHGLRSWSIRRGLLPEGDCR